jgi:hypothetical protein
LHGAEGLQEVAVVDVGGFPKGIEVGEDAAIRAEHEVVGGRGTVVEGVTHDGCAVKGALLALESALPGKLLGMRDYSAIRELLHNEFRAVLNLLADGTFHRAPGALEAVRKFHPNYVPKSEAER